MASITREAQWALDRALRLLHDAKVEWKASDATDRVIARHVTGDFHEASLGADDDASQAAIRTEHYKRRTAHEKKTERHSDQAALVFNDAYELVHLRQQELLDAPRREQAHADSVAPPLLDGAL